VDINDPAFREPTKPVGAFFLKEEAELLARSNNWVIKEDPRKRGWRRVVASPRPLEIVNKKIIRDLVRKGTIVIAAGGGGVPVYRDKKKQLQGIEAVIDKDLASCLLANEIEADHFFLLTDVKNAYINFNKPGQKALETITVEEAKQYLDQGEFSKGSMGPKIEAAIEYVEHGGKETIITESSALADKDAGTRIVKEKQ
jgi:carbamate kinase